ncbi:MAG: hypothetical protein Q7N87_03530 [Candidatus Uhrbacteria bacterium]|nr:hypothetical protein [Candidatus Uhrbacteria bacterium]
MEIRNQRLVGVCFTIGCLTMLGLNVLVPSLGLAGLLLGALGGAIIGYVAYDLRETWRGMVHAAKIVFPMIVREIGNDLCQFFAKPRPFFYLHSLVSAISLYVLLTHIPELFVSPIVAFPTCFVSMFLVSFFVLQIFLSLMSLRPTLCNTWQCRTGKTTDPFISNDVFMAMSWKEFGWFYALVFYSIVRRFTWDIAVSAIKIIAVVAWGVAQIPRFIGIFLRHVHSDARLATAVDGPLGAVMAYVALRLNLGPNFFQTSPLRQLAFILVGGLVSLGLGLVSAHMLKSRVADPKATSI